MNLNKVLMILVAAIFTFGIMSLHSQCENAKKWDDSAKYKYLERHEVVRSLEHRFGKETAEMVEKALGKKMAEATDQELKDYLLHLEKDVFPMESISKEHEESMQIQQISKLGRLLLFAIGLILFVGWLRKSKWGDDYRIIRILKKFDIGFKPLRRRTRHG